MGTTLISQTLLLLLLQTLTLSSSSSTPSNLLSYSFPSPSLTPQNKNFFFSLDSGASQGALQITPDTSNNLPYLVNKAGRVLLNTPFTLHDQGTVASFNSSFTVNIFRLPNTTPGQGFAFLIAPELADPPPQSHGQYLGLTNATTDSDAANHIVAIELDTVKQSFDPDDNHVGLDINSVRSNATASLSPFGIAISPVNSTLHNVWIDYDGGQKRVRVYMAPPDQDKPRVPVLTAPLDLIQHVLPQSYFGFAASTGDSELQLNCVRAWNLSVEALPSTGRRMTASKWALAIALPLVAAIVVSGAMMWWYFVKKRKVGDGDGSASVLAGTLKSLPGTPREFEFKVLRKATNDFDEGMKLGQGGFGVVYKGVIPGEGTEVAVKKFSRDNMKGQDDFLAELSIINRLRHKRLVRLLGWCHKNGMLLLVYEFMHNGSLDQHLFSTPNRPILTWNHRYNILSGVASALHYLHNEYDNRVIHRDLKASNVLLDSNFNARLGDFGLARALDTDRTSYIDVEHGGVAGTMGYIAPECFHTGKATTQSDVFAFGAVVLEVVCGRRPRCDIDGFQFLADWVWKLHREDRILDAVDERLGGDFVKEDAVRLLLLGLACTHPLPKERPKTAGIVQILSRSVAPPAVPPFKPAFVWPSGLADEMDCTDDSMTSTTVTTPFSAGWTPRLGESFTNGSA